MANAQAVVVSALEDYGLVPIEANACGTPVIAYGAGGVLDTQIPGFTGLFFEEQTSDSLHKTLLKFPEIQWEYAKIREHAIKNFSEVAFFNKLEPIFEKICGQRIITKVSQSKVA